MKLVKTKWGVPQGPPMGGGECGWTMTCCSDAFKCSDSAGEARVLVSARTREARVGRLTEDFPYRVHDSPGPVVDVRDAKVCEFGGIIAPCDDVEIRTARKSDEG